ncbi:amidase signature domain-containing protein [Nemania abortiva]|nr:amidase signature domain-containing protein [Nemania abortiva]
MPSVPLDLLSADVRSIQKLLQSGNLSIPGLVDAYLVQVEKYNPRLRALLCTAPRQKLLQIAEERERELQVGKSRGPLHGIPIILKDNIDTDPSLGMPTTAGSLALLDARPRESATLVDLLVNAGAIILGKANLSELMNCKGRGMMAGWSAVGGQCVSAYVEGGIKLGDKHAGHSSPGGSSTGCAVGVSAGFAPVAIGAETSGSLVEPATRAALYSLKPTIHLISQQGLVPVSHTFDSAGPMTKSVYDLAVIMDVLSPRKGGESYTEALKLSWSGLRIGTLHPAKWRKDARACEPDPGANAQMDEEIMGAYRTISPRCAKFVEDLTLPNPDMNVDGTDAFGVVNNADYKADLTAYLQNLEFSSVRSIQQLIDFNKKHHFQELPSHHPRQDVLEMVVDYPVSVMDAKYKKCLEHLRLVARDQGIDCALQNNDVDVIIGPADSELASIAAAAGYPIATMPLSYLKLNGRPFGVVALASANEEMKLIEAMSAWESTFPNARRPPAHYGLSSPHT